MTSLREYLQDPFLNSLYNEIRNAGPIRSVSIDITHECNLRCKGCYFFSEKMDSRFTNEEEKLYLWIENEKKRGTNFVTVVGGEAALVPHRLKKLYQNFKLNVATNGLIKIPTKGLENLPIGVAVWGNSKTDSVLRSNGKRNLFDEALRNYKNDSRAFWYYTVAPGYSGEIREVVEKCVSNGNKVLFNYYSDLSGLGGNLNHRNGFDAVREEIEQIIDLYPENILSTRYLNQTVSSGTMMDQKWGFDVCTNLSENFTANRERLANGRLSNPHFRAYNADFETTRRCCTGISRSCESCFDTWEHFSWIMINMRKHLQTESDFCNWLFTTYMFYFVNKLIETTDENSLLKKIHSYRTHPVLDVL